MKKRLLSVLLAALLLLSCLPVFASASDVACGASVTSAGIECPAKRGTGDSQIIPYDDADYMSCVVGTPCYVHFMLYPNGNNNQTYVVEVYTSGGYFLGDYSGSFSGSDVMDLTFWFYTSSLSTGTYYVKCYVVDANGYTVSGSTYQTTVYLVSSAITLKSLTVKDEDGNTVTGFRKMSLYDDPLWLYLEYNPYNATGERKMSIINENEDVAYVYEYGGWIVVVPQDIGKTTITVTVAGVTTYFGIEVYEGDPCAKYTDINRSLWYHTAVDFVIGTGIMGSTSTSKYTFEPNTACTRSMIVSILYRLEGDPTVTYQAKFPDVPNGQWYTNAVIWAYQKGIVKGYDNGKFGPFDKITREQMAVILKAYTEYCGISTSARANLSGFPDANKVTWSKEAVRWAVAEGLISGKSTNGQTLLDPQGNATRAEVASILMRYIVNLWL